MRTVVLAVVVASMMSVGAAQAADRFVSTKGNDEGGANTCLGPAACRTIANALAHAVSGAVIKVARGTYKGSVAITDAGTWTIRGGYGPDFSETNRDVVKHKTTVTGDRNKRFLLIAAHAELITVTLDGLAVSNSKIASPPLVLPTGGGILATADDGALVLSLNAVTVAGSSAHSGGGLSLRADGGHITARITSSLFKNNKAHDLGGAISIESEDARISLSVEDSRFENNKGATGGAISMRAHGGGNPAARIDIFRSVFLNNVAVLATGGAIDVWSEDQLGAGENGGRVALTMENSVLQGNRAAESGGAVTVRTLIPDRAPDSVSAHAQVDLRNNTIAVNKAGDSGGGLAVLAYGVNFPGASSLVVGTLLNNIIRGNTASGLPESDDILLLPQGESSAIELDLITNNIGQLANLGATLTLTPNPQLDIDPKLVRTRGVLRLKATSPMIDAGTCDGAPVDDFEGNARPTGTGPCGVDIGADELSR